MVVGRYGKQASEDISGIRAIDDVVDLFSTVASVMNDVTAKRGVGV